MIERLVASDRFAFTSDRLHRSLLGTLIMASLVALTPAGGALEIQFDYRYDTSGFFSGPNMYRRAYLDNAAEVFELRIQDSFAAISPSGGNTWTLSFPHPATGEFISMTNLVFPTNTIVIFPGARPLEFVAYAEYNYSWAGFGSWATLFLGRDSTNNFDSFGGSISFDPGELWYFDGDPGSIEPFGGYDFHSVALHEIAHLLGFTKGAAAFRARTGNGSFVGPNASAAFGGSVPLDGELNHLREGLQFKGQEVNMDPTFSPGVRKHFTELEFSILQDIGYLISPMATVEIVSIRRTGETVQIDWHDGVGPFRVEAIDRIDSSNWWAISNTLSVRSASFVLPNPSAFFRIVDLGR
jgi:hypothetical protein